MRVARPCVWMSLLLACPACGPAPVRDGFAEADPGPRLDAVLAATRAGDDGSIDRLVELLDSDDPAVRLAAIAALERIDGETRGYVHYDDRASRDAAIERWVESRREATEGAAPDG